MNKTTYINRVKNFLFLYTQDSQLPKEELDTILYLYFVATNKFYPTENQFEIYAHKISKQTENASFKSKLISELTGFLPLIESPKKIYFDVTETSFAFYNSGAQRTTRAIYKNIYQVVNTFRWNLTQGTISIIDEDTHELLYDYTLLNNTISISGYQNLKINNRFLAGALRLLRRKSLLNKLIKLKFFLSMKSFFMKFISQNRIQKDINHNELIIGANLIMTEYAYLNRELHSRIQMLTKFGGVKLHLLFYDSIPFYEPEYFSREKLETFLPLLQTAKCAHTIYVPSKFELDRIRKLINNNEIRFILLYFAGNVEIRNKPKRTQLNEHQYNLIIVAGLEPRKNLETMIRGVADAAKIIDINLNIVAVTTSDISNITNSIDEISYLKSINVFSKISDEEIVNLYTNSDLSVFCTLAEGFGIPIAESGWLNVPIVASNVGTIKEVAELFAEAILVDPRNHLDISNGIVRAIKYKDFNKVGALNRRTWNQVSQELLNSIE